MMISSSVVLLRDLTEFPQWTLSRQFQGAADCKTTETSKLREGIIASRRSDAFSLEVYQTSLNLSVIFRMAAQTTAIVTQLIPHRFRETGLYQSMTSRSNPLPSLTEGVAAISLSKPSQQGRKTKPIYQPPQKRRGKSQVEPQNVQTMGNLSPSLPEYQTTTIASNIELAVLISLLNILVQEYPRRASFHSQARWFYCLDNGKFWNRNSPSLRYTMVLTKSLINDNFTLFEQISRESSIKKPWIK
ncbi:hypothetical protein Clacol_002985 [Clathrus columnatus]|uniref:Uncharacterized protein n=1 Tax=Clathrus columnatus TaxID=1419009 RepID=A0AAV5A879_9AGAM|nr:hypothetical protein Clacol_002985 [Clathrus columnatus]